MMIIGLLMLGAANEWPKNGEEGKASVEEANGKRQTDEMRWEE
jgi:hypothetical protein